MLKFLFPDYRFDSILDILPSWLREQGFYTLFVDVDNTLKYYHNPLVEEQVAQWVTEVKRNKIQIYLVSNGRGKRIRTVAKQLDLPYIAPAYKPFPFKCRKLLKSKHLDPRYVAMVGDQIFADIMAGNLVNICTIYIKPMAPQQEPFFTRMKRPFERLVLHFAKENGSEGLK